MGKGKIHPVDLWGLELSITVHDRGAALCVAAIRSTSTRFGLTNTHTGTGFCTAVQKYQWPQKGNARFALISPGNVPNSVRPYKKDTAAIQGELDRFRRGLPPRQKNRTVVRFFCVGGREARHAQPHHCPRISPPKLSPMPHSLSGIESLNSALKTEKFYLDRQW